MAVVRAGTPPAIIAAGLLGLATVGDMFLYLAVQRPPVYRPPPFRSSLGTALTFMLAATPFGRLADRIGRLKVFLLGHALLARLPTDRRGYPGPFGLSRVLLLHGLFYASCDGVLMAHAGPLIPPVARDRHGGGPTAQALARAAGALAFGAIAQSSRR